MKSLIYYSTILLTTSLLVSSCEDCYDESCLVYSGAPSQIISIAQAKEMYDYYEDRRIPDIITYEEGKGSPDFKPTRYMEYDYSVVKQYLAYIEDEAKKANVDIQTLRIYFANYGDDSHFDMGDPVKVPRHNTTFMVPTTNDGIENLAFYTINTRDENKRKAKYLKDLEFDYHTKKRKPRFDDKPIGFAAPRMLAINLYPIGDDDDIDDDGEEENSLILNDANLVPPPKSDTDMTSPKEVPPETPKQQPYDDLQIQGALDKTSEQKQN